MRPAESSPAPITEPSTPGADEASTTAPSERTQSEPAPWQPPGYHPPPSYPAAPPPYPPQYGTSYPPQYPPPGYQPYPHPPPTQWYPLPPQHGPWGGPLKPTVLFARASTERVSRLSVGFRLFLAIPSFIVVFFLVLAQLFVGLAAWLAAVFTARVPVGLYNFIGYVVGYSLRVNSYFFLLTDKWPTLSADAPYPVAVRYPGPERLNRAAVIFRLILFVPVYFVTIFLGAGLAALWVPFWLITLIGGRVMNPIFDSVAATVRYQTRAAAYYFLLTSAYPSELFVSAQEDPRPQVADRAELLPPQRSTGARRLLVAIIVLGVAGQAVQFSLQSLPPIAHLFRDVIAESDLSDAYTNVHVAAPADCPLGPGQLRCLQGDATVKVNELRAFDATVAGLDVGSSSKAYVEVLRLDTAQLISDYQRLIGAPTLAAYHHDAALLPLAIGRFEEAENALDDQLLGN